MYAATEEEETEAAEVVRHTSNTTEPSSTEGVPRRKVGRPRGSQEDQKEFDEDEDNYMVDSIASDPSNPWVLSTMPQPR